MKETVFEDKMLIVSILFIIFIFLSHLSMSEVHTWLFSMEALCLSHMGLISMPLSRSRSPCVKNSLMIRSVHLLYSSRGFVGLLRSAQWTMFCRT